MSARRYLLHHRHEPEVRRRIHVVQGPAAALAQLPFFVARRSTATEIREVRIP